MLRKVIETKICRSLLEVELLLLHSRWSLGVDAGPFALGGWQKLLDCVIRILILNLAVGLVVHHKAKLAWLSRATATSRVNLFELLRHILIADADDLVRTFRLDDLDFLRGGLDLLSSVQGTAVLCLDLVQDLIRIELLGFALAVEGYARLGSGRIGSFLAVV